MAKEEQAGITAPEALVYVLELEKSSDFLKLPDELYGTISKVGMWNNEPILYGDINLVKPNDLFYIPLAKLVYRYVKSVYKRKNLLSGKGGGIALHKTVVYYFDYIEPLSAKLSKAGLSVPEEEKGTIRKVGNLFNKPIYSGDPNMVDSNNLYYHQTLPLVSEVKGVNEDGDIEISTFNISGGEVVERTTEYKTKPEPEVDYVDLGLPSGTLWAKKNLGAESETDTGLYFAWAETQGYTADLVGVDKNFSEDDYVYYGENRYTKYNKSDGLTELELTDDAAYVATEGQYAIPTTEQLGELLDHRYVTTNFTKVDGVDGILITSIADNTKSIFLPQTNLCVNGTVNRRTHDIYFWTNERTSRYIPNSLVFFATLNKEEYYISSSARYYGCTIRPVVYVAPESEESEEKTVI